MQVILLKDIQKIGHKYDVVEVSDGYASNFLLPQALAERATSVRIAEMAKRKQTSQATEDARRAELLVKLGALKEQPITLTMKADEQGHLYKKVHAHDIVATLKNDHAIELDESSIILETPLAQVGEHAITVEAAGKTVTLTVAIIAE
jgi:large subunit ribosomal protein L9